MKKLFLSLTICSLFWLAAVPVHADQGLLANPAGVCNKACQVNEDCGQGYRCYVGICRALACPSSQTCGCAPTSSVVSATPAPKVVIPAIRATPVATVSARIQRAPVTGSSSVEVMLWSAVLAVGGMYLKAQSDLS